VRKNTKIVKLGEKNGGKPFQYQQTSSSLKNRVHKVFDGQFLTKEEIISLLRINHLSVDAGYVMAAANILTRTASKGKAEVHAQIGLNLSPCPNNCSFCAFAAKNGVFKDRKELSIEEIIQSALRAEADGANAIFFMTTHDYPFRRYIEISKEVRSKLKPDAVMITNIGDFGLKEGREIKEAGYTGIYHAVRMGEGRDTGIDPKIRLNTINAAQDAGLLVGTCVEPIGPEHSIEEIAEKILIGREMKPCYSGAMRRISIPGSEFEQYGMISEYRLAFLVAVVRLAMGRNIVGNCTHEPNILGATGGANLFWAEVGTNPRDTEVDTSQGRGTDVKSCMKMFREADFDMLCGPSIIYSKTR
jgi:biotin synthase